MRCSFGRRVVSWSLALNQRNLTKWFVVAKRNDIIRRKIIDIYLPSSRFAKDHIIAKFIFILKTFNELFALRAKHHRVIKRMSFNGELAARVQLLLLG